MVDRLHCYARSRLEESANEHLLAYLSSRQPASSVGHIMDSREGGSQVSIIA